MKKLLFLFFITIAFLPNHAEAARLYSTGFEIADALEGGASGASAGSFSNTTFRSGVYALRENGFSSGVPIFFGQHYAAANNNGPFYIRFYLRIATSPSAENRFFAIRNTTAVNLVYLTIDNSNVLKLYDEDGQITGTATLTANTWYRIEVKVDSTAAAGSHTVEAKVDGAAAFASSATRSLSTGSSQFIMGANIASEAQTTGDWFFDDVAVNDSTGTTQNSYAGDGQIVHLKPNAAGDNAMGSRGGADTGSDHGQVNDIPFDDATDYYVLDINNDILDLNLDSSATAGIGASDTITLVQVGTRSRPATAAALTANARIKSQASGTVLAGTSQSHNDTGWKNHGVDPLPRIYQLTSYTDPQAGGAWTASLLDTTQIGAQVTDATPDYWITSLWALVEYVPAVVSGAGENYMMIFN